MGIFWIYFYVRYLTLLHLPLLRFHGVGSMLGSNPRTVTTTALAVRRSNHSARSHPTLFVVVFNSLFQYGTFYFRIYRFSLFPSDAYSVCLFSLRHLLFFLKFFFPNSTGSFKRELLSFKKFLHVAALCIYEVSSKTNATDLLKTKRFKLESYFLQHKVSLIFR
jgi:hypothetical protein